jgi:hypothetical protein
MPLSARRCQRWPCRAARKGIFQRQPGSRGREDGGVAFALPMNLVEVARRDPFLERREWVDGLPEVVDELAIFGL